MAQLDIKPKAVPRHITVGGSANRLFYSHYLGSIVSAVTIGDSSTLKFIDPDTGIDLSYPTDKEGNRMDTISGLGKPGDRIMGILEWNFTKSGKTWKWILVSTKLGKLLVVETAKIIVEGTPKIRCHTIYRMKNKGPITAMATSEDYLFYCDGLTLRWDVLDTEQKRFASLSQYDLPSMATSMYYKDNLLMMSTVHHSLIAVSLDKRNDQTYHLSMAPAWSDETARQSQHFLHLEDDMVMLSDKDCAVTGIWHTSSSLSSGASTLFEADLPASIMRLRTGRTRPRGDSQWAAKAVVEGIKAPNKSGSDILGMGIDGSMFQLSLINEDYWRLLRFVQNCAEGSKAICPFTYDRVERYKDQGPLDVEPRLK